MHKTIPDQVQVVIIGGGVIGASVAWHLTDIGCRDVAVLERGQLGCGTSWHSAGHIIRMDVDPHTVGIYTYGAELMAKLHSRSDIGWRQCGRVMLARSAARVKEFHAIADALGKCGVAAEFLSASEVAGKLPIMRTDDVAGALWSPGDGRVNPTDLVNLYAREASAKGARIIENVCVEGVITNNGRVIGVRTSQGKIRCETVVNCAGLWARDLGLRDGVAIPLYAVEHFYLLTETMDGVYADMPTFRDPDGLIYGREDVGGLLLGCFDQNAIPISPSELPEPFYFSLLNENWDQFGPYLEQGIHRIPALKHVGVKMLLNGPESFTPDSHPILDKAPNLENYYVLAGLSSAGVTRSAGMGRAVAHWIVENDPGTDVSRFSLSRFSAADNQEQSLREQIRHAPSGHFATEH